MSTGTSKTYDSELMLFYLQKFEAYDSKGSVVAGDKDKEVISLNCFASILVL
jgi:hypothetical protein